jgi:hypothetical protein
MGWQMSAARLVLQLAAEPADLTPAELPDLLDRCEELSTQIEAIRNRARELLAAGEEIDGWELVQVRRTDLIDAGAAFLRVWTDHGREVALAGVRVSLPAVARALAKDQETTLAAAKLRLMETLGGLVAESESPRLVRAR